jgi:signal transduction histidine kinase
VRPPRLTVRARLTLLYTGLFAVCSAIVVGVSYSLVAQLGASTLRQPPYAPPPAVVAQCRSDSPGLKGVLANCVQALEQQGALHQRDLTLSHLVDYSLITLGLGIALAAVLGWILAGRALRPLHRITAAARAASDHNLSSRVALRGPRDELLELAETFDDMLDRLQRTFNAQRQFIANASHELRTPLTVMRTTIDVVLEDPDSSLDDLRVMASDVRRAADRAESLISALLILARNERGLTTHDEVDLATVAEDVIDATALGDRQVHATLEPAVVSGDPMLLERLVVNLVENAVRHNTASGDIWITTRTTGGASELTIANTGLTMSPADVSRIFDPFQRLNERASRDGFGLGLAIVASIAVIHGGTALAQPRNDGGLIVGVTIPSAGSRLARRLAGQISTDKPVPRTP